MTQAGRQIGAKSGEPIGKQVGKQVGKPISQSFGNLSGLKSPLQEKVEDLSTQELAQALAERLTLTEGNWHKQKANRGVRAKEQVAAALVFLLRNQPQEALPRLEQAVGWLNRSISAPPCPDHGNRRS